MLLKVQRRFLKRPVKSVLLYFSLGYFTKVTLTLTNAFTALSLLPHEAADIVATFEGSSMGAIDVMMGTATVMEIYWIFDVKHSRYNKNTLTVHEHFRGFPTLTKMPIVCTQSRTFKKIE